MSRGQHDGLLMFLTDINVLFTIAALIVLVEVLRYPVSGFQMGLMCLVIAVITMVMVTSTYIDGFGAFMAGMFAIAFQGMFVLLTVEAMMPIDIWWFYYPVIYLTVWIFEGAYLICLWGKDNGCKE